MSIPFATLRNRILFSYIRADGPGIVGRDDSYPVEYALSTRTVSIRSWHNAPCTAIPVLEQSVIRGVGIVFSGVIRVAAVADGSNVVGRNSADACQGIIVILHIRTRHHFPT